jgi:hypothetical protein
MQTTGGLVNDIVVFGVFVYLILLLTGKVRMRGDKQEKLDDLIHRKGTLLKILAYGGAVIFAVLILIGIFSFIRSDKRSNTATQTNHPWIPLKVEDTTQVISQSHRRLENDTAVILRTHLKDTTYAAGNFILFLRPDDDRYAELEKVTDGEGGDSDGDFGVGISATQDSLKKNDRYKNIKVLITTKRYIYLKDCKGCPLVIDRDTVSYGYILSATGRSITKTYNSVHGGDYLGELREYFSLY